MYLYGGLAVVAQSHGKSASFLCPHEADQEDGPEPLALSPNFSHNSSQIDEIQDGKMGVIKISSEEGDGDDCECSDYSDKLQFQL
jgi:hypothetical protein